MFYQELKPSPDLASMVQCYWISSDDPLLPNSNHGIVPGGYVDIVFNLGGRVDRFGADRNFVGAASSFLVGPFERFTTFIPSGRFEFLGIRFHIGKAPVVGDLQLSRVRNCSAPLSSVCGRGLAAALSDVETLLCHETNLAARIAAVEGFLLRLFDCSKRADWVVSEAIGLIEASSGHLTIGSLSSTLGTDIRRIERMFSQSVGLSPKAYARIARFKQVRDVLQSTPFADWSSVAHATGYYDQTHFINEFRSFTGQTPHRYRQGKSVGFFRYSDPIAC